MPDSNNAPGAGLPEQLIGKKALRKMVPVADMTIWRWEHATDENGQPKFPKRIRLGPGRVAIHRSVNRGSFRMGSQLRHVFRSHDK